MSMNLEKEIKKIVAEAKKNGTIIETYELMKEEFHKEHPMKSQPINRVRWVDVNKVQANDYNPNMVASKEMQLLLTSINHDGYTQPCVTIYDEKIDKFVIIDGFHRYSVTVQNKEVRERNNGKLPIVVLDKSINDRMASTVRHNRARGEHSVKGMAEMVYSMLENGWEEAQVCNELGMEAEELVKLKHMSGYSKRYEDHEFSLAWMRRKQIEVRNEYRNKEKENKEK